MESNNSHDHIQTIECKLDLSYFPLLRIDQLPFHDSNTLVQCEEALHSLISQKNDETEGIALTSYAQRLIELIRIELTTRRVKARLYHRNDIDDEQGSSNQRLQSTTSKLEITKPVNEEIMSISSSYIQYPKRGTKDNTIALNQNNTFVVTPAYNKKKQNTSFRNRAKIAEVAIKARKFILSEEYQKQLFEERKKHRREMAVKRIKDKKVKRNRMLVEKAQLKKVRRLILLEERKTKHDAIIHEMKKVAMETKSLVIASGNSEAKGDEIAAIAAAKVLENEGVDTVETDSGTSLASEVDDDTVSHDEVENSRDDCEISFNIEDEQIINHDDYMRRDEDISTCLDNIKIFRSEEIVKARDHYKQTERQSPEEGKLKDDNKVSKMSESNYDSNGIDVNIDVTNPLGSTSANIDAMEEAIEQDKFDLHITGVTEITWQPWSISHNECNCASRVQKTSHNTKKYVFTEMFPTFYAIFTAFSYECAKIDTKTDMVFRRERACLEYQIILQKNLLSTIPYVKICPSDLSHLISSDYIFKVSSWRPEINSIISEVLSSSPYKEVDWKDVTMEQGLGNCWNLLWTWKKPKINPEHLLACQKISRFQNTSSLTRKDYLKKKLETFCTITRSNAIMPKSFILPGEYNQFVSAYSSCNKSQIVNDSNVWIMKPIGMSRGRGISIVNDIGDVSYSSPSIIQKYISNPLLFREHKFDLRLYVTVLSFSPLEAYIYKEGFARFSSKPFTTDFLEDIQIHLTNSSIQKQFTDDICNFDLVKSAGCDGGGNKVKLSWLWKKLDEKGISSQMIWKRIIDICVKTLNAVSDDISHQPNAFELFGFDILIDSNLRPWLIEVNSCPSLARDTDLDTTVKEALIEDTIKLVRPTKINRIALKEICERRLQKAKASNVISVSARDQLEEDLSQIFCHSLPRKYGEYDDTSNYECLIPLSKV